MRETAEVELASEDGAGRAAHPDTGQIRRDGDRERAAREVNERLHAEREAVLEPRGHGGRAGASAAGERDAAAALPDHDVDLLVADARELDVGALRKATGAWCPRKINYAPP